MKCHNLTAILTALAMMTIVSCGIIRPRGAEVITSHEAIMEILQEHFPDLYNLHEQGLVEVDEIYSYHDRQGQPAYKVSFRYLPPHDC